MHSQFQQRPHSDRFGLRP